MVCGWFLVYNDLDATGSLCGVWWRIGYATLQGGWVTWGRLGHRKEQHGTERLWLNQAVC